MHTNTHKTVLTLTTALY